MYRHSSTFIFVVAMIAKPAYSQVLPPTERPVQLEARLRRVLQDPDGDGFPAYVHHATAVAAAQSGKIFLLSTANALVSVFDSSGVLIRSFGRRGGGPGEFGAASDIAVSAAGNVAVHDYSKGGVLIFGEDGSYKDFVRTPAPLVRRIAYLGDMLVGVFHGLAVGSSYQLIGFNKSSNHVIASVALPQIIPIQLPECGGKRAIMPPALAPEIAFAVNGTRLLVASLPSYSIKEYDALSRRREIGLRLDHLKPSIAAAVAEDGETFWLGTGDNQCTLPMETVVRRRGVWKEPHLIRDIVYTPNGGWWVRRRTGNGFKIDVFNAVGKHLGTLPPNTPFPIGFVNANRYVAIRKGELDENEVVIYDILRTSK
ncbi:MAG: 6-bladed beta-propeller [Gemmatimonadota bacterium]